MGDLLSRDVLYGPLRDLSKQYPKLLEERKDMNGDDRKRYSRLRLIGSLFNRATFGRTGITLTHRSYYEIFLVNRVLRLIRAKCPLTDVTLLSGVNCISVLPKVTRLNSDPVTGKLVRENFGPGGQFSMEFWSGRPISMEFWSGGTNFFRENWSSPENFGPTMDQFS